MQFQVKTTFFVPHMAKTSSGSCPCPSARARGRKQRASRRSLASAHKKPAASRQPLASDVVAATEAFVAMYGSAPGKGCKLQTQIDQVSDKKAQNDIQKLLHGLSIMRESTRCKADQYIKATKNGDNVPDTLPQADGKCRFAQVMKFGNSFFDHPFTCHHAVDNSAKRVPMAYWLC